MEKMLLKLARQLESLDEASLMALWSKYATMTNRFEPTKRWEEACLIFSLIQAKRWKNQLFNYCWSQQRKPPIKNERNGEGNLPPTGFGLESAGVEKPLEQHERSPCRVLSFRHEDSERKAGKNGKYPAAKSGDGDDDSSN